MNEETIEKALVRNADVDAGTVKVAVNGGRATLSGSVGSWGEKTEAWNAPGGQHRAERYCGCMPVTVEFDRLWPK